MTARIHDNQLKGIFIGILFLSLMMQSIFADAQSYPFDTKGVYKGFAVDFSTRSSKIVSNIAKINESNMVQSGGQVGLVYGNSIIRAKAGILGYYTSGNNTAGTIDLYTSNANVNLYPLSWISGNSTRVEPYITGGVAYDQYKYYGHYMSTEPAQINYSNIEAPYLGKMKQVNATLGLGLEVKLTDHSDFIHVFSEIRYGQNLSSKTENAIFESTEVINQTQIMIGVTFGAHR